MTSRPFAGRTGPPQRIRDTIRNPYYAGWIAAYGERIEGDHEPLIERSRWERIKAMLRRMDPAAIAARQGGRPTTDDYLLRGIAHCGECGRRLYVRPYRGIRFYVCAAVRQCLGVCTAPHVRADIAEAQVLARLDTFVGDVETWIASRASDANAEREQFAAAVANQRSGLAKLDRRAQRSREQHDRLLDEGDHDLAARALRELARIEADLADHTRAVELAEQRLADWDAPDVDAALDYYTELREAIGGRVRNAKSVRDLNASLRTVLEGVWLSILHDDEIGDTLVAEFALRGTDTSTRPPEIALATRVDHWRRVLEGGQAIKPSRTDPRTRFLQPDMTVANLDLLPSCPSKPDASPSYYVRNNRGAAGRRAVGAAAVAQCLRKHERRPT